jgi:hypothetical protein
MIQIDKVQQIEGVVVYGDESSISTFYLLPQQPRFRLDERGNPVFKMLKYRTAIDRPGGIKAGGFLIFDVEFVVDEAKLARVKTALEAQIAAEATRLGLGAPPPLVIGTLTYTDGSTKLNFLNDSGVMVANVFNPGKPSLFGNNITPFSVELTPEGATLAEQALQGKGGVVQVVYDLTFTAKLPEMKIDASFSSTQFYSFYQTIDIEWNFWSDDSYRQTLRETLVNSEAEVIHIEPGGITDQKVIDQATQWATKQLETRVEKAMIAQLTPVPDDQRNVPDGIEHVTRDIQKTNVSSFSIQWVEKQAVDWDVHPQGTLPNITNLKDGSGAPLKWDDFFTEVDLDDVFFKQVRVDVGINADFEALPIHSVEVKLEYDNAPMPVLTVAPAGGFAPPPGEVSFAKGSTDPAHFGAFVAGDNWKYSYSYQVNYVGESRVFQSPVAETDEGVITVGVDDVGILLVDVGVGDINWSEVSGATVDFTYEDDGIDPIAESFELTKDHPAHRIQQVIFQPLHKSYSYTVKYRMADDTEYSVSAKTGRSRTLYINDPFAGRKTVKVVGAADFQAKVRMVTLDLAYADEPNHYKQSKSVALTKDTPFIDWSFPVIDADAGDVTYSGQVLLADGTVHEITPTTTGSATIIVPKPPVKNIAIAVITDLIEWTKVKLVQLHVTYTDDPNLASTALTQVFTATKTTGVTLTIPVFDPSKLTYTYTVTYFLPDGTRKVVGPLDSQDDTILLELPA